jgi:hypothetical protein
MDHLEAEDLLTLRGMNKTLYRLIGATFGSKLKKKLASRCVSISTQNCIQSLENFITETSWAFEGMKMNSSSSNQREEDFETFPLPFSDFRLQVVERSSFNQPSAAMSTLLDRYASSIQRLWIDKFWCCLPAESGEGGSTPNCSHSQTLLLIRLTLERVRQIAQ